MNKISICALALATLVFTSLEASAQTVLASCASTADSFRYTLSFTDGANRANRLIHEAGGADVLTCSELAAVHARFDDFVQEFNEPLCQGLGLRNGGDSVLESTQCKPDPKGQTTEQRFAAIEQLLAVTAERLEVSEQRVANLQAKLASLSIEDGVGTSTELVFTGVNVHVRNGMGSTEGVPDNSTATSSIETNGLGNLIVGYNEPLITDEGPKPRNGSHNLVVGIFHSYSSVGGLVAGINNTVSAEYSAVSGGANNTASGTYSSVSGGANNIASGHRSSVSGGATSTASGPDSSVAGGHLNTASARASSVPGGLRNTASGAYSSLSGGRDNIAEGQFSSVSGGERNTAAGSASSIAGGRDNTASANFSSISGN